MIRILGSKVSINDFIINLIIQYNHTKSQNLVLFHIPMLIVHMSFQFSNQFHVLICWTEEIMWFCPWGVMVMSLLLEIPDWKLKFLRSLKRKKKIWCSCVFDIKKKDLVISSYVWDILESLHILRLQVPEENISQRPKRQLPRVEVLKALAFLSWAKDI